MRKTTFVQALCYSISLFCFVAMGMICHPAFAQDAMPAVAPAKEAPAVAMPKDPKALMLLAAKTNGLTGDDIKPWHLKASWKMLDKKGGITDQGTYEEFWVSPTKFKRTFTGAAFTQTDYGTEKGILRSGTRKLPVELIADVRREFADPFPDLQLIQNLPFELKRNEGGDAKFICLGLESTKLPAYVIFGETWCLATDLPVLRIRASTQDMTQVAHNGIISFQNHFIATDLQFAQAGKPILTSHLESIEPLQAFNDADLAPSPDAIPIPKIVAISSGAAARLLREHDPPVLPRNIIRGSSSVVLRVLIDKDGHVVDLHFIGGTSAFKDSAIDAVRKWRYRPYLLDGEPTEVETIVNVIFSI